MIANLIAILVLMPFLAGILCFLIKNRSVRNILVIAATSTLMVASVALLMKGPSTVTMEELGKYDWAKIITILDFGIMLLFLYLGIVKRNALVIGLTILQAGLLGYFEFGMKAHNEVNTAFVADWLGIVMTLVISIIGSIIVLYAIPYMKDHEDHLKIKSSKEPRFFLYLVLFLGAMNGLVLSNNLMWLYFFWEVTTLCCFMLIRHNEDEVSVGNAYRALWMNLIGGIAIIAGIILLTLQHQPLSIIDLIHSKAGTGLALLPLALLCLGGFTKSAQMPFQPWLLGAMVAPTPVSSLLHSSTMVKAGVYLIIRFAPAFQGTYLSDLVAIVGAFTFVTAAMLAISQTNAKRVLAYSTISNLGLIITCAGINTPVAISAAIMLLIFHAISKALLFMAVGVVEHRIWSREIEDMEGLIVKMPLTTILILIGILSMLLPPFGVLVAKWVSIEAATKMPLVLILVVLGSAFTAVFWTKWMGKLVSAKASAEKKAIERQHILYTSPLVVLAVMAIVLSLFTGVLTTKIIGPAVSQYYASAGLEAHDFTVSSGMGWFPVLVLFIIISLAVILPALFVKIKASEVRDVYLCGENVEESFAVKGSETVEFKSAFDKEAEISVGSYYFDKFFGEKKNNSWINSIAIVIIIILLGVTLI